MGVDRDQSWYEGMEARIDERTAPFYPGDSVFSRIAGGELDPLKYGMLPYLRGWEWCLWVVPMSWRKQIDRNTELVWVDGARGSIAQADLSGVHPVFGMLPGGLLIGEETFRFSEGIWLHDQIIDKFQEASSSEECTNTVYEKSYEGAWYFPDVIVMIEDMFTHVDKHRAMREKEDE